MRNFHIYIVFFYSIALTGCNKLSRGNENTLIDGLRLFKTGEYRLEIEKLGTINFIRHQVFEIKDSTFIFLLNKSINALEIYNLTTEKFAKRINIPKEGPYAINNPQGFLVISSDSIFVFPQGHVKNTILINGKGDVLSHYSPPVPKNDIFGIVNHKSVPSAPSYFLNKRLHFSILPMLDTKVPENINRNILLASEFEIDNNTLIFPANMCYPKSYLQKGLISYHTNFSRIINDRNEWIYSFAGSDSLYIYDINYILKSQVAAKSKAINNIPKFDRYPGEINSMEMCIKSGSYGRIIYDKFKNNYYRIVQLPREYEPNQDYDVNALAKCAFSVIKFDEQFNKISETNFNEKIYDMNCIFITNKGLNIPRTNYWNKELTEEVVNIDVFN
ncbi:DUF4221 family protein [Cyclobacterium sp. 1_MG-2023]|uniref:DUF4221 family protein n=1 Tax=Cyclobacterium sp. 1_MG-2023 TaxID=3062681 RepID=UPI0026E46091|nr:DUF4221 family protein [Cyclobacterium sp. 1_MG-2023]MDO6436620.1 DUF4221 family protein [Cyclobacterium sp. 1_MG-2023]